MARNFAMCFFQPPFGGRRCFRGCRGLSNHFRFIAASESLALENERGPMPGYAAPAWVHVHFLELCPAQLRISRPPPPTEDDADATTAPSHPTTSRSQTRP